MDRVSSKMSLIAAQISSVETSTTSSTQVRAIRNGSAPICFTATPSAKIPTCSRITRSPRRERRVERRSVLGLDPDDAGLRPQRLDVGGDTGDQAAPADLDEDRVEGLALLADDLHPHRALPGNDVLVVERRDEDHPAFGCKPFRPLLRPVVRLAREHHLRPEPLDRIHLDARRRLRHDDEGAHPEPARAASATPCAWLPAEDAMTPRARSSADSDASLL